MLRRDAPLGGVDINGSADAADDATDGVAADGALAVDGTLLLHACAEHVHAGGGGACALSAAAREDAPETLAPAPPTQCALLTRDLTRAAARAHDANAAAATSAAVTAARERARARA